MSEGSAQVRGTLMTFVLVGFSMQDLYFDSGGDATSVLGSREKRQAYYCEACEGIFVAGNKQEPKRIVDPKTGIVTERE